MTGTGYLILVVVVAALLAGGVWYLLGRRNPVTTIGAFGPSPAIPAAFTQSVPTLKMPKAIGWKAGDRPVAAPGLSVTAFATGLKHPRWIYVLPNGDVLVAESAGRRGPIKSIRGAVTRYVVELDEGGSLVVMQQNLTTSSMEALQVRGKAVRLIWRRSNNRPVDAPAGASEGSLDQEEARA